MSDDNTIYCCKVVLVEFELNVCWKETTWNWRICGYICTKINDHTISIDNEKKKVKNTNIYSCHKKNILKHENVWKKKNIKSYKS